MTVNCVSQDEEIRNPFGVKAHQLNFTKRRCYSKSSTAMGDNAMFPETTFNP
jgi:hypothetical protein